jgi:hypothetical protein
MGERKKRAKGFKETTDKSKSEEIDQPGLFSDKVVESDLTCECFRDPEDSAVAVGEKVRLIDMRDRIDVFARLCVIGHVVSSKVDELRHKLRLGSRKGRSIGAVVIEVSDLTATFVVRINR